MSSFLPDESTLAGRLFQIASAAELGLLTAEYQQKRRRRGRARHEGDVPFSHAPRPTGLFANYTLPQFVAAEALSGNILMDVCLHCFAVQVDIVSILGGKKARNFCSKECAQAAERARSRAAHQKKRSYIRFGLWDTAAEASVDLTSGEREPGVSVFDAFYDPEDGCYRLDTVKVAQYARQARRCLPLLYARHIFIITGDETAPGIDGEPCLHDIRLIAPAIWRNQQIVPIPLERLLWLAEALGFGTDTSAGNDRAQRIQRQRQKG